MQPPWPYSLQITNFQQTLTISSTTTTTTTIKRSDTNMGLKDIESTLPPGFRFYPSDEELVCHYLYKKVANEMVSEGTLVEVDLHTREPWELPDVAKLSGNEWYFFSFRDRKYATGSRTNRATKTGYWKATGKDRTIYNSATQAIIGMRKTLVFYRGRAPNGMKTGWVMHEFRLETPHAPPKEDWVLCRVFHKRKAQSDQQEYSATGGLQYSSPTTVSSPPQPLMQDGLHGEIGSSTIPFNSSNTLLNMALMQCNFVDFPQEEETTSMFGVGSKGVGDDDEYGFLLDVGMEDHCMGEGNLGGLSFPTWQG